jgi:phenylalanyl-tRNA synthetase beta chain
MLVSFNWLKEFVEIERSAAEVAELLTMGGMEVEGLSRKGAELSSILTARIEEITPHPSADRLQLARVRLHDREETVVCGAPNIAVGRIVPYAAPGAVLPGGQRIEAAEVRGVRSAGMLCSERELDLTDDHSGIMQLENSVAIGVPLTEVLPFVDDYVLETSVTPNRGDCLSMVGTAREVAALSDKPWKRPDLASEVSDSPIQERISLEVPDSDLCPRYVATMVEGLTIGPSPLPVRVRLHRAGMRPISNVVDATNLILLECGQPLHAFDWSLLRGRKIVVRRCDPGESFVTLDGENRKLPDHTLMIRDAERSVALAGIMGGLNSEINEHTESVLIESACFEPFGVRRTAKALGMSTEASFRFERGVDPEGTLWAALRAAQLIQQTAGGRVLRGHLDAYPRPIERPAVTVRTRKVNGLLGVKLTKNQIRSLLKRLDMEVHDGGRESCSVTPPSWRWDLPREVDMIEEVARVYGFQNIPVSMVRYESAPDRSRVERRALRRVARVFASTGFTEIISMSFVPKQAAWEFFADADQTGPLGLMNPLTEDISHMRTSLLPGLLAAARRNVSFRNEDLRLFELGRVFEPTPGQELPRERHVVAGVATGARYPALWHFQRGGLDVAGKITQNPRVDFYDVKGALENLFEALGIGDISFVPSSRSYLHAGKSADVLLDGEPIGFAGQLTPAKCREHGLEEHTQLFEILLEPLLVRSRKEKAFRPIPRYPYIVSGDTIKRLISRLGHDIIVSVNLFDLYRGESIPIGYQSMAFRIRYQSPERTLTDEEVETVHSQVASMLAEEVGASMRE